MSAARPPCAAGLLQRGCPQIIGSRSDVVNRRCRGLSRGCVRLKALVEHIGQCAAAWDGQSRSHPQVGAACPAKAVPRDQQTPNVGRPGSGTTTGHHPPAPTIETRTPHAARNRGGESRETANVIRPRGADQQRAVRCYGPVIVSVSKSIDRLAPLPTVVSMLSANTSLTVLSMTVVPKLTDSGAGVF